jgi:phosphoserine phosphatase
LYVSENVTKDAIEGYGQWNWEKPSLLVFDVNETLIDFESMAPLFERIFGNRAVLREWLGRLWFGNLYHLTAVTQLNNV